MNQIKTSLQRFSPARVSRVLAVAIMGLLLSACGEGYFAIGSDGFYYEGGYDYHHDSRDANCGRYAYPAVVVEFFAAEDGLRLGVDAEGEVDGRGGVSVMRPYLRANDGLLYSLAGGFDRVGLFDVFVSARRPGDTVSQTFVYRDVRVREDRCGPITVFLDATLD
ncbi:MAG: hypothetical protein ACRBC3_17135 [Burkholderiaceae bacterium]